MSPWRRLWLGWIDHPSADYVVTLALAVTLVVLWIQGWSPLSEMSRVQRSSWSMGLATVTASLLGFGIAAVSILFAVTPGPRLAAVLTQVGHRLSKLMMSTLGSLAIVTLGLVLVNPLDQGSDVHPIWIAVLSLLVAAALGVVRLLWLLGRTVAALSLDVGANREPSPTTGDQWDPPELSESDFEVPRRGIG